MTRETITLRMQAEYDRILETLFDADAEVDYDIFLSAACGVGRNCSPTLLVDLWSEGAVSAADFPRMMAIAWQMAEFPERYVERDSWLLMFDDTGYCVDGRRELRPGKPIRLFRGACPERAEGMAWTDNAETAQWFANRFNRRGSRRVYTAVVEPIRLLARITERGESEYVIDPTDLPIDRADAERNTSWAPS